MGSDYYAEGDDGELRVKVRVENPDGSIYDKHVIIADCPEDGNVYIESRTVGGVRER